MENIIAKLLRDYEEGKMSRRELIKSLALTVSIGAAGAAGAARAGDRGFKAAAVNHISYQVKDYARTRDFYADLLGMKVSQDDGKGQCYLVFGDSFLIPRNARVQHDSGAGVIPRVDHIAYTIENWNQQAVKAELQSRGLHPREDTVNSYHVKDPDGFDLQISGKEMKP